MTIFNLRFVILQLLQVMVVHLPLCEWLLHVYIPQIAIAPLYALFNSVRLLYALFNSVRLWEEKTSSAQTANEVFQTRVYGSLTQK